MNSIVVEVNGNKYLIRFKVLKSVVSRKHTTKEGKVIQQLEKHPSSCEVHLYKINCLDETYIDGIHLATHRQLKAEENLEFITYLGRGLSKCSVKDKFDKNKGIRQAIANIKELNSSAFDIFLAHDINYKILNTEL